MTKTRQDNDLSDCPGVFYIENDTELSWTIELGAVCDENQVEQLHDWSYRCSLRFQDTELSWLIRSIANYEEKQIGQLHNWSYKCDLRRKQNWVVLIDETRFGFFMKTRQDNDVINCIGLVYIETETQLWGPILPGADYDEN